MKSSLSAWLILSICFLITISCNETIEADQANTITTFTDHLGKPIKTNLKGKVVNQYNEPLDSVIIVVGDKTSTTDRYGNFVIENAPANKEFVSLETQRKDYKNTVVNLVPKKDTTSINIVLHKESDPCLFWFCRHNHNLPKTIN